MTAVLLDTHILFWLTTGSPRLGRQALLAINSATQSGGTFVSAITPWEIAKLVSKGKLQLGKDLDGWMASALSLPGVHLVPLEPQIAIASARLPGSFHKDPADQIIVASARHLGIPLVTVDQEILVYGRAGHVETIDAKG